MALLSRKQTLEILHNDILKDMLIAKINVKVWERKEILGAMNTEISKNTIVARNHYAAMKDTYTIVLQLLNDLEVEENQKSEKN